MGQLDTVLFTRLNWEEIGGFPGMILTTSETGMRALTVCGPAGIEDFLTSTRFFLQRNEFVMHVREFKGDSPPPLIDNMMIIHPIVLDPSKPPKRASEQQDTKGEEITLKSQHGETKNNGEKGIKSKENSLTGIAYVPSARKNQRIFIRKDNVEHVVSLMFSKRRQLTEYEEIDGSIDFYDTRYAGRKRNAKKEWKSDNLNQMKDAVKMRLACNDAKLLVHEDYFGANPNMATNDESDGEADAVLGPNSPVGVVPDTTPIPENKDNSNNNNNNNDKTTNDSSTPIIKSEESEKVNDLNIDPPKKDPNPPTSSAPLPLAPATPQIPAPNFSFKLGTPFDASSLSSFPSISGKPAATSLFGNSVFGSSSPFPQVTSFSSTTPTSSFSSLLSAPFPSFSPATQNTTSTLISSVPDTQTIQATDIFGRQSDSKAPPDPISLFGNSAVFEIGKPGIGNNELFQKTPPANPIKATPESPTDAPDQVLKRSDIVLCYACHMKDVIRLDNDKALALGIPPGPLFNELREGKTVKSETTGNLVTPQECLGDPIPGPAFLVIYCPTLEYMPYILENENFEKYFEKVEFVVHLTHHDALSTDAYKQWMHKFNTIQHVIINKEVCTHHYVYPTSAVHQYRMNALHENIFPLPFYKEPTAVLPNKCNCSCGAEFAEPRIDPRDFHGLPENTSVGEIFLQLILYPHNQQAVDRTGVVMRGSIPRCKVGVTQLANVPNLGQAVEQLKLTCSEREKDIPSVQPRLLFLGTASALPSKYRNVSGIYFEPTPGNGMLLDAGEGSYGMLYRRFGEKLNEVISTIKAAWISHIHADHHLGLIRILLKRIECNAKSPLMVIGPRPVGRWLSEYDQKIQNLYYDFVDCADITSPRNYITPFFESVFGFKEIYTMEVMHCAEAFGLVITHKAGWKFVISGDTRPCPTIETEGKDAFLLIHEATLETGLETDAHIRGHSTCGQALDCFKRMNAQWVILTHFSQRYPSIPKIPDDARDKVGIAYDLMDIRWSDIPILPHLLTPMGLILEYEDKARASAAQRTRDYYEAREKKLVQERARTRKIKYHFAEDDEEDENENDGTQNAYYNRFGRGRGSVRGFCVDPTKRRGKVCVQQLWT
eukprot:Phypoly_transcript_00901.p1 GENE.Phypoly_transcript_00901~~Phypoly_transcript_00901.p1  ORF type:complete len:1112 (+),score=202.59 Phypoly_transcript_00901:272-3607(+)